MMASIIGAIALILFLFYMIIEIRITSIDHVGEAAVIAAYFLIAAAIAFK